MDIVNEYLLCKHTVANNIDAIYVDNNKSATNNSLITIHSTCNYLNKYNSFQTQNIICEDDNKLYKYNKVKKKNNIKIAAISTVLTALCAVGAIAVNNYSSDD